VHYLRAELLRRLGRRDEAAEQFQKALDAGATDALRQLIERQRQKLPK
jgi:predicted RNA polymerase sigma factor